MEQGVQTDCLYCTEVYPELRGRCPVCGNGGPTFTPAQMMDRESSMRAVLDQLFSLAEGEQRIRENDDKSVGIAYRRELIGVLKSMAIYDFELKDAIVARIHDLDREFDIDPEKDEY